MRAAQYLGPQKIKLVEIKKPQPAADEVLLQIKAVGICGTDLHIYNGGMDLPTPLVPGHEFAGSVSAVGKNVKRFKKGDRVTAEHVIPCGQCAYCRAGKPNLCLSAQVIGLHRPGALAEYLAVPANLVYKFPASLSFEEAALIEPLSIGLYALNLAGEELLGKKVAVVGQGPIGILLDQLLKLSGAYVVGIDILPHRLKFVKSKHWVDEALDARQAALLKKWLDKADASFEVVGREKTAQACIDITRRNGNIYLLGVFEEPAKLKLMPVVKKELHLHGSWTCAFSFPESIELAASGKIDLKSLITHRYKIDEVERAFREASRYSQERIKTLICFD